MIQNRELDTPARSGGLLHVKYRKKETRCERWMMLVLVLKPEDSGSVVVVSEMLVQ